MYRLPADDIVTTELAIKRSRFITYIGRCTDEESARAFISEMKANYPDARHHCSAYIYHVDNANPVERSSDDGEPSGTAGNPMLEVLRGSGLENIVAVVIRYFGGVKLGTGGLVRAYTDAVAMTLDKVRTVRKEERELYTISLGHDIAGKLEADLRGRGYTIQGTTYGKKVTLTLAVAAGYGETLAEELAALTQGTIEPCRAGSTWIEIPD